MPRSSLAFTREPIDVDAIASAISTVLTPEELATTPIELRPLDDGAALQVTFLDSVVLTVLRPRLVPSAAESRRVFGDSSASEGAVWYAEAYTPWAAEAVIGQRLLEAAAASRGGNVTHQG